MKEENVLLLKNIVQNKEEQELNKISGKILPLISDVMFKIMLCNENHKDYLAYFLKDIINVKEEEILKSIKYVKNTV